MRRTALSALIALTFVGASPRAYGFTLDTAPAEQFIDRVECNIRNNHPSSTATVTFGVKFSDGFMSSTDVDSLGPNQGLSEKFSNPLHPEPACFFTVSGVPKSRIRAGMYILDSVTDEARIFLPAQ